MNKKTLAITLILLNFYIISYATQDYNDEASDVGIIKEIEVDIDNDGENELVRATWGPGVSDKPLKIEILRGDKIIDTVHDEFGIQSNYALKDTDGDGKLELIIWSGLWDFRLPGEDAMTEEEYEGHSGDHRYIVSAYKWLRDKYWFWEVYTTKKKYPAWSETMPPRDQVERGRGYEA